MLTVSPSSTRLLLSLQVLAACLTGLLIPLSFTGPAVVLPALGTLPGASAPALNWVLNAYILSYGSAMMVAGSLTDVLGRRRVWLAGLALFCLSTLAIAAAPSVPLIAVLRFVQGLGGAAAFAAAMSSLAPLFQGAARNRVMSLLGTTFGVGLAFGPLAAGQLMMALAAPLLVVPLLASVLLRWCGAASLCAAGLLLAALGLSWLAVAGPGVLPLLLIGAGIGLPWGLMDAMALNVVEARRAGMATGIFNTVRVSADGVALAVAGAVLAGLIGTGLAAVLPAQLPIAQAASRAALGDLQQAAQLLPGQLDLLRATYAVAFRQLLLFLSALAVATASLLLYLLKEPRQASTP